MTFDVISPDAAKQLRQSVQRLGQYGIKLDGESSGALQQTLAAYMNNAHDAVEVLEHIEVIV